MTKFDRRTLLAWTPLMVVAPVLSGCGGDEPPPPPPPPPDPTIVGVTLRTSALLNPDSLGRAKPAQVRLLRLGSTAAFMAADYYSLAADPAAELGGDLIGIDTLTMAPATTEVFQYELDDGTLFLGLFADYRAIENARWRATFPVPQNKTTLVTGDIGPDLVSFRPGP